MDCNSLCDARGRLSVVDLSDLFVGVKVVDPLQVVEVEVAHSQLKVSVVS